MRRSPIILGATIAGTAGVLAFHPHAAPVATATKPASPAAVSSSAASPSAGGTGSGSGSSPAAATTASRTATGAAISTQYGNAQVRVTVKGGKLLTIQPVQLQGNDPRSVQISSSAEPTLQQEALTRQSAGIDAVSGATYTSASYTQSLQSALDKLGFKAPDGSVATLQVPA